MKLNTLFKANLMLKTFGFTKIPLIGFVGPKVIQLNDEKCVLRIKLKRKTKNHLNTMYIGVLSVGADLASGMLGLYHIQNSGKDISLIFKDFKADFLKRPDTDVDFVCAQGAEIKKMVEDTILTGERQSLPCKIDAMCNGKKVCEFVLTLSLKHRSK